MAESVYIPLAPLLTLLGIMLTLALVVERLMMVLNWLITRLIVVRSNVEWHVPEEKTESILNAERALREETLIRDGSDFVVRADADPREIVPHQDAPQEESRFDVKKFTIADKVTVIKEFWIQLLGTTVAIIGCSFMKFSIWPMVTWPQRFAEHGEGLEDVSSQPWEYVVTGIIIGAGSKPVYFLMNFLINRRITVAKDEIKEEATEHIIEMKPRGEPTAAEPSTPRLSGNIEEIVGFQYDGGNRPTRIEHTHARKKKIDMIVYHHTAMHSDAPFEELINEFDRKGWLTGYHCVVMKDGTIRVLTRWDRIGSHALGYNDRSLGIAFQGNFEPDPSVPFSNANGRLGILYPTSPQLDAAARVVSLWNQLYKVKLDFNNSIVPHNKLAAKACPGSNFPHDSFKTLIKDRIQSWKNDTEFPTALKRFKSIPMVTNQA